MVLCGGSDPGAVTITVRNRCAELCNEDDDITKQYGKFVQSNAEAAEKLPVRKRAKRRKLAEDARVVVARTEVQKAFESYNVNTSSEAQQQLQSKKEELK